LGHFTNIENFLPFKYNSFCKDVNEITVLINYQKVWAVLWPKRMFRPEFETRIKRFELQIQRREIYSSLDLAHSTLMLLHDCIDYSQPADIESDLTILIKRLHTTIPFDVIINNCCRKVLDTLSQEMQKDFTPSVHDIIRSHSMSLLQLFAHPTYSVVKSSSTDFDPTYKSNLKAAVLEYVDAIPETHSRIAKVACDFIHDGDLIMTLGRSKSILAFFERAHYEKRKFSVIIPERAPYYDGYSMAKDLQAYGIKVVVIEDSAVFAVMPRVSSVIVPVRAVLADGTLITISFMQTIALAAKHYSVPLIVLYWKWKLTENFKKPGDSYSILTSPNNVILYSDSRLSSSIVLSPEGEAVSGQNVTMFINEDGAHGPADIFPQVQSLYDPNE